MGNFTHFNDEGRAKMVDVSEKTETTRIALAQSSIIVSPEIYHKITRNEMKKGDVLGVAQVAGVMAAKNTWSLIPMCHPIPLTGINLSFFWEETTQHQYQLIIHASVKTKGRTGVERKPSRQQLWLP